MRATEKLQDNDFVVEKSKGNSNNNRNNGCLLLENFQLIRSDVSLQLGLLSVHIKT